jgi:hypothetical protein
MAIVLPVLLLVLFGIIDFGRVQRPGHPDRGGARRRPCSRVGSADQRHRSASEAGASIAQGSGFTVRVTYETNGNAATGCGAGTDAVVNVLSTIEFITPFAAISAMFGGSSGDDQQVSGEAVMACVV